VIEAIFVINLGHRSDRRQQMERELKRQGLLEKAEFVEAVGAEEGATHTPNYTHNPFMPLPYLFISDIPL
jgi:hypothetical protein